MPPTASSYTKGIDVVTRDAAGVVTPLESESVKIRYAGGADILTAVTANQGYLEPQLLASVPSETLVEFYSATKTGTLRMISARLAEDAYSDDITLILDDAFADTKTAEFGDVYLRDNTDPDIPLEFLGSQPKDSMRLYLKETSAPKDFDVFVVPRTKNSEYGRRRVEDSAMSSMASVGGASLAIDITTITDGSDGDFLYNNAGILGAVNLWLFVEHIVASFTIDLESIVAQTAYTVPTGFDFILTKWIYLKPSEDLTGSLESISAYDRDGDALHEQLLNESIGGIYVFDAVNKTRQIVVDAAKIFTAGDDFNFQMSGDYHSTATMGVDIFGYFREAAANYLTEDDGDRLTDDSGNYLTE